MEPMIQELSLVILKIFNLKFTINDRKRMKEAEKYSMEYVLDMKG